MNQILETIDKPLKQALAVKESIKKLPMIPDEDFEVICKDIDNKTYKCRPHPEAGGMHYVITFSNGYLIEYICEYEVTRRDLETNEPIAWDSSEYTISGGEIFKDGQMYANEQFSFEDF